MPDEVVSGSHHFVFAIACPYMLTSMFTGAFYDEWWADVIVGNQGWQRELFDAFSLRSKQSIIASLVGSTKKSKGAHQKDAESH